MNTFEKTCIKLRHLPLLNDSNWVWDALRPTYNFTVGSLGKKGLKRRMNGQDELLVIPKWRGLQESYEPLFWNRIMSEVKVGDAFVDVGGFIGLYSISVARRIGATGKVYVFEPDKANHCDLCENVKLNGVEAIVKTFNAAVTDFDGSVAFHGGASCESHIDPTRSHTGNSVECWKLDTVLPPGRIDLMKVDVEGFEEHVLRGAQNLLVSDDCPRSIYIEVHPFAWQRAGTTSDSLLHELRLRGYKCFTLDGAPVNLISEYGSVIARRV